MANTIVDDVVADYLRRLSAAAGHLPRAHRRALVEAITAEVAEARTYLLEPDEPAIRELLDGIGRPEDIAAEAMAGQAEQRMTNLRIMLAGAAIVIVASCLAAAMILGRGANGAVAAERPPTTTTTTARTVPNTVGMTTNEAATTLEAMGIDVLLVPDAHTKALAGSVTAQAPAAGSPVRRGEVVTLTYATAPTAARAAASVVAATSTTPKAPATSAGTYVDGGQGTPHYFVSLTVGAGDQVHGSVGFIYQDGQTGAAFTVTGTVQTGVMTLYPSNVQRPRQGMTALADHVPTVIMAPSRANSLTLGDCTGYLTFATSLAQCTFTYASGPNGT